MKPVKPAKPSGYQNNKIGLKVDSELLAQLDELAKSAGDRTKAGNMALRVGLPLAIARFNKAFPEMK